VLNGGEDDGINSEEYATYNSDHWWLVFPFAQVPNLAYIFKIELALGLPNSITLFYFIYVGFYCQGLSMLFDYVVGYFNIFLQLMFFKTSDIEFIVIITWMQNFNNFVFITW
jgi:hypothetical protein